MEEGLGVSTGSLALRCEGGVTLKVNFIITKKGLPFQHYLYKNGTFCCIFVNI